MELKKEAALKTHDLSGAAELLKISETTMRELAECGTVPAAKVGKRWVFDEDDLSAYLRDVIRRQTEERREHSLGAPRRRVKTEVTGVREVRGKRSTPHPVLPPLP